MTTVYNLSDGAESLPCLYRGISIENPCNVFTSDLQFKDKEFTTDRKKSAYVLAESVDLMASKFGLNNLGFLTLTFSDHVVCPKEAQKRLNSLFSNVVKPRYGDYVGVFERQKSGRIHYHLLVNCQFDLRTGFDFEAVRRRDYSSASQRLKDEWHFWRSTARKYRFGRTELLPVISSAEAIKFYIGKYISKSFHADTENRDKGVRLVRYSRGARAGTTNFSFATPGYRKWREALCFFAELVSDHFSKPVSEIDDFTSLLGDKWAYKYRDYLLLLSELLETKSDLSKLDFDVKHIIGANRYVSKKQ